MARARRQIHDETVEEETDHILEESRMVLPGIQALFGFQLVAIFNESFATLAQEDRVLHLLALGMVTCAVALVLCPAAYHRLAHPGSTSEDFTRFASRCLTTGMGSLMVGLTLDVDLVSTMVLGRGVTSTLVGAAVLGICFALWFVVPMGRRLADGWLGPRKET